MAIPCRLRGRRKRRKDRFLAELYQFYECYGLHDETNVEFFFRGIRSVRKKSEEKNRENLYQKESNMRVSDAVSQSPLKSCLFRFYSIIKYRFLKRPGMISRRIFSAGF